MATKAMTVFRQGGEDYTINDPNIADEFSSSAAYAAGTYVNYQGNLYKFTADHAAGSWTGTDVTAVKIGKEVSGLTKTQDDLRNGDYLETPINALSGYIAASNGAITSGPYHYSQLIKVKEGDIFKYISAGSSSVLVVAMYETISSTNADTTKSIKGNSSHNEQSGTIPSGIQYIRFCYPDAFATESKIAFQLRIDELNNCVKKNGENEVKVINIEDFEKIGNLNDSVELYASGKIIDTNASSEHLVISEAVPSYNIYIVKVPNSCDSVTISFAGSSVDIRIAFLEEDKYTYTKAPIHNTYTGYAAAKTEGAKYVMYCYAGSGVDGISTGMIYEETSKYNVPDWFLQVSKDANEKTDTNNTGSVSSDRNSAGLLKLNNVINGLKKGEFISGEAFFTTFVSAKIGLTNGDTIETDYNSYLEVTPSSIIFKRKNQSDVTLAHGLTITNYIKIKIELNYGGGINISLFSDSGKYENNTLITGYDHLFPFFDTTDTTTTTYAKLTWSCSDFMKKYWFFGDSYISDDETRWMHYYDYK